jgi:hypothetical protein
VCDTGEKENYRTAKLPPVNTGLFERELTCRQHDGGPEHRPNLKCFIAWANEFIKNTLPAGPGAQRK